MHKAKERKYYNVAKTREKRKKKVRSRTRRRKKNTQGASAVSQCGKSKNSLTLKISREINSIVTSLVKTLFSRNICQKRARENFHDFHTVFLRRCAYCIWKNLLLLRTTRTDTVCTFLSKYLKYLDNYSFCIFLQNREFLPAVVAFICVVREWCSLLDSTNS